jgi:hypothetical protein
MPSNAIGYSASSIRANWRSFGLSNAQLALYQAGKVCCGVWS